MEQARLNEAYSVLLQMIAVGVEYPDAIWKVSQRFNVSHDTLQQMYDGEIDFFEGFKQATPKEHQDFAERALDYERAPDDFEATGGRP